MTSSLIIASPLEGWSSPLDEVPDPVFAERMMGDGLAIDPTGATLHAPFDGEITSLPATGHALVIRSECGAEMLMHVGLETVALAGEGFIAHVCEGQRVHVGDRLLSFDLDFLAQRAKSLITPVILTNGEQFEIVRREQDRAVVVGQQLMQLRPRGAPVSDGASGAHASRTVRVMLEHGLHARPAAMLSKRAQAFAAQLSASANGRRVNAKSPVALMTLGVKRGDDVLFEAIGADAQAAIDAVASELAETASHAPSRPTAAPTPRAAAISGGIKGVCAAPGLAIGVAVQWRAPEIAVREQGAGVAEETAALEQARTAARTKLELLAASGDERRRDILGAHIALLDDPELAGAAARAIANGKSAGFAWRAAIRNLSGSLSEAGDAYLAERAADLRDIEAQVLSTLPGAASARAPALPKDAIILAEELLPSQFAELDHTRVAGLCMAAGGATSHVAILAASLGIPAVVAAGPRVLDISDGAVLVLDADAGALEITPTLQRIEAVELKRQARAASAARARGRAGEDGRTADGVRIAVYANLGGLDEVEAAIAQGAEGCGLLRTEFLFMDRREPPSEVEQAHEYQAICDAMGGRLLTIRTLDVGADKALAFLPLPAEENPALGVRGIRVSLQQPDLLRTQLAAILRVRPLSAVRILLPMVTDASEIDAVRTMLAQLGAPNAALGAMVETPAAAMLADQLAERADFLSIGSNDLSQYVLAMDRGHPGLAGAIDALHPAVLATIARACEGAAKHQRSIGVCGAIASDPIAAPILVGLGVDSLSTTPATAPHIKEALRRVEMSACRALAARALQSRSAAEVRALATSEIAP